MKTITIDDIEYNLVPADTTPEKPALKLRPDRKEDFWILYSDGAVRTSANSLRGIADNTFAQGNASLTKAPMELRRDSRAMLQKIREAIAVLNHERGWSADFSNKEQRKCLFDHCNPVSCEAYFIVIRWLKARPSQDYFHPDDLGKLNKQFSDADFALAYLELRIDEEES